MIKFRLFKKFVGVFGLLYGIILLSSCEIASEKKDSIETINNPSLQISYNVDQDVYSTFTGDELGDTFHGTIEYLKVKDVVVSVDNSFIPLEEALRDNKITFHEIHYLAQKDAAAGICYETLESKRGLTRFTYDYISYKLIITNDIYETPDGKQHHIQDITVATTGSDPILALQHLDQEDWGIEFEIADVSTSGITLNYTQSGGQLIGQLIIGNYDLSRTDIMEAVFPLDYAPPESIVIQHNTKSTITLDFEQRFGVLESGEYLLYLYLHDNYDPDQVPPLIRNYHDMQCYTIEFTIP